jgi:peptidoglycan/xylan/chitin deacetylase (PgdA/CDA1 family)
VSAYRLPLVRRLRPRAAVLCYHRVADPDDDPYGQAVRPETFARHLEHLVSEHPILPLDELVDGLPGRSYRDGTVAITFDDGYADNFSQALPIAGDLPVTVFITVNPILNGEPYWWDEIAGMEARHRTEVHARLKGLPDADRREQLAGLVSPDGVDRGRPLTLQELRELASWPGVEIGAHSLSHPALALLSPVEQERELTDARSQLEELLDRPVRLLAYPFGKPGDVSKETRALARRAGYRAAFMTVPRRLVPSSPLFALPRLTVHEWPVETFANRLRTLFSG